jgi:protein SCO1/2
MKINKRVAIIVLLVLPALLYLVFVYGLKDVFFITLDYVGPSTVEEKIAEDGTVSYDTIPYTIPDFSFINHDGATVTSQQMRGNIYVASFFFATCPTICPAMNFHLGEIQSRFKGYDDFYIISHTVNPEKDSVQALHKYTIDQDINTNHWYFVTGNREELYGIAERYFLSAYEDDLSPGGFLHSQNVVLIDWDGHIRSRKDDNGNIIGAYDVLDVTQLKDLEEDIKVLKAEYERYKHNLKKK